MEGWKFAVVIAFLCAARASADDDWTYCNTIDCSGNNGDRIPIPNDECAYCCCLDPNQPAGYTKCPRGRKFNPRTLKCDILGTCDSCEVCDDVCQSWHPYPVGNSNDQCKFCWCNLDGSETPDTCPCGFRYNPATMDCDIAAPDVCPCPKPKDCGDIACPYVAPGDEVRYPDPADVCSFCCCLHDDEQARTKECPFHEMYDPTVNDCVDSGGRCPNGGGSGGGDQTDRPKGGCETVRCPVDPKGEPLHACPNDPQSFCQCDWGRKVHQMPCGPGTTFYESMQTCL